MWFGDLIDLREQGGGGDGAGPTIYIRLPVSELGRKNEYLSAY